MCTRLAARTFLLDWLCLCFIVEVDMPRDLLNLEPLADHRQSRFGNIYNYNLASKEAGMEVQLWTSELQEAVTHYLVHEVPGEDWGPFPGQLGDRVPRGIRAEQVAFIIADYEP